MKDLIYKIYKDKRTVFNVQEMAMLSGEPDFNRLKQQLHYYVKTNRLWNLRRGIYAKENYTPEELACKIYKPSYISLEYVLQKSGIIFQFDNRITAISYLSRNIHVDGNRILFRKIKNDILYNTNGIIMDNYGINMATPERSFLDTLYLNKEYYFDSINSLDKEVILKMLPIYQSKLLNTRVLKLFKNA